MVEKGEYCGISPFPTMVFILTKIIFNFVATVAFAVFKCFDLDYSYYNYYYYYYFNEELAGNLNHCTVMLYS